MKLSIVILLNGGLEKVYRILPENLLCFEMRATLPAGPLLCLILSNFFFIFSSWVF